MSHSFTITDMQTARTINTCTIQGGCGGAGGQINTCPRPGCGQGE